MCIPHRATSTRGERALGERLEALYRRQADLEGRGEGLGEVRREIIDIRRQQRDGPQLMAGYVLAHRYQLIEVVGTGGFATVWKAYDAQTRAHVAIKLLHSQHARNAERVERFERGARLMQRLAHPHVVRVLEAKGEDEGYRFFVMELLRGDLWTAIREQSITPTTLIDHIIAIAEALSAAHAREIIHRDVKPENILLDPHGVPKLTDFDLVRAAETTGGTKTGALGTLAYAAPEAIENASQVGPSVDVYGLAMTIVVGLRGGRRPTFSEKAQPSTLVASLGVSPALTDVLQAALQIQPDQRPKDAGVFLQRLEAARAQRPSQVDTSVARERSAVDTAAADDNEVEVLPQPLVPKKKRTPEQLIWEEGDDRYGRYADVVIRTSEWVPFRMRWVAPGTFSMGSPEGEKGRRRHEGPQHKVTLKQGFWLADAPCTQAAYKAVMGTNPSRFKGRRPPR